ncbi:hypothetical protein JRI60_02795 [Archangium violaceum]|uniref:hypothetical protein n=1 Tax=Archangium violaceum TaxID=83451 RepID=UPI00195047CD|nr:hypothetical protein [Archangium violaceum]QRN98019.1 hypothetical protein JRI60_02795 [Archangium violaceum]
MSSLKDTVVTYVDEQLRAILAAPGMWGSDESVEMQVLQLLEFRSVTLRPELEKREPRTVLDAYHRFLKEHFKGAPPYPLFVLVEKYNRKAEFIGLLKSFSEQLIREMQPDDIFASHDLVLRLLMRDSVLEPRASSLSSYYEALHKVLRAISRRTGTRGRASHELEEAIDFALSDVIITPANGHPAQIVLPLDQVQSSKVQDVQRGLQNLVAVNEWAASSQEPVESLLDRLSEKEEPERIATLAMRLVPSEEESIQIVEMGGRLVGGSKPVEIRPAHAERMFTVVKQRRRARDFDQVGIIRAVDMDQRSMRIKTEKRSYKCFFREQALLETAREALGEHVRVSGQVYESSGLQGVVEVAKLSP